MRTVAETVPTVTPEPDYETRAKALLARVRAELPGVRDLGDVVFAQEGAAVTLVPRHRAQVALYRVAGWKLVDAVVERPPGAVVAVVLIFPDRVALSWQCVGRLTSRGGES